eukprot:15345343-Alexandrium_andersonii.AAC.1
MVCCCPEFRPDFRLQLRISECLELDLADVGLAIEQCEQRASVFLADDAQPLASVGAVPEVGPPAGELLVLPCPEEPA